MGNDLLMTVHFIGLAMGGAAGIGLPVVGAVAGRVPPAERGSIARMVKPLKIVGHAGMGLLLLTGAVLATTGGYWSAASGWFWVKLAAVALLIAGIVAGGRAGRRAFAGDAAAAQRARQIGIANIALLVLILLAASLAFS